MRALSLLLLAALAAPSNLKADSPPLSYAGVRALALADPDVLRLAAELAELRRALTATGGLAREAPTVSLEAGPRRLETSATSADVAAELELPVRLGGGARRDPATRLARAEPILLEAARAAAEGHLKRAFVEAWRAQRLVALAEAQLALMEGWLALARRRVEAGAEAPYEVELVVGERLRAQGALDLARRDLYEAWGALRARADLPASPLPLSPPVDELPPAESLSVRFENGWLRRAIAERRDLDLSMAELQRTDRRERWSLLGSLAKEGEERVARLGLSYRFPFPGEPRAIDGASRGEAASLERSADVALRALETRFQGALARARSFGEVEGPETFEGALAAVSARLAEGKERPFDALQLRRQLLEGQLAAIDRRRDALLLAAELAVLTKGARP